MNSAMNSYLLLLAVALLNVDSSTPADLSGAEDRIFADAILFSGPRAVREIITFGTGLAAISGSSVHLFDAETLQSPHGRRPTGVLLTASIRSNRSQPDDDLHSLLHMPTLGCGAGLVVGTGNGQIKFFKNVTTSTQAMEPSHKISFCDGADVPVTKLSHVVFGYKHFFLASSNTAQHCGVRVLDLEGDFKQTLPMKGQVAAHRLYRRNKLVIAVNDANDCVLQTYGYKDNLLVTLLEEALRLKNMQCGQDLAIDREGRLLVPTTPSAMSSVGGLVHIVDVGLWTDVLTLASTKWVEVIAVSAMGAKAFLIASAKVVSIFDLDGQEIHRLDMNGVKCTSALAMGKDQRRVIVGGEDGSIRFINKVAVPENPRDEYVVKVKKGPPQCLTADDRNSGPFGFGGLKLLDCDGSPLSDDHQLWADRVTEMKNKALDKCVAGVYDDYADTISITFMKDMYGCIQNLFVAGGLWYTNSYNGGTQFGCIGDSGNDGQFALFSCGGSLEQCIQSNVCTTGWQIALPLV